MPIPNALRAPAVQNLAAATAAGLLTLAKPGRFPRWARSGIRLTRTASTIGAVYLAKQDDDQKSLSPASGQANAANIASAVATATSSVGFIASGLGVAADRKVEGLLVRKGVRHPRLWMAAGVVVVIMAAKTAQEQLSKRVDLDALAERQRQAVARAKGIQSKQAAAPSATSTTSDSTPTNPASPDSPDSEGDSTR